MNKLARVQAALASSTDADTIIVAIRGPAETVSMTVNANPARPADLLAIAEQLLEESFADLSKLPKTTPTLALWNSVTEAHATLKARSRPIARPERYDWDAWADDVWNSETGAPGIESFGAAVQAWSIMQNRKTSVAEAARAFNCLPSRVIEAVDDHPWMDLEGPEDDLEKLIIYHEGE